MNKKQIEQLERAKQHAIGKGGECLSNEYVKNNVKMVWQCKNLKHKEWHATYNDVVSKGHWCSECGKLQSSESKTNIKGLETAKAHAEFKNGQCLSNKYIKSSDKLLWRCENLNHKEWYATYNTVVNKGHWCNVCRIEKRTNSQGLETAKALALSKDGKCLSAEYVKSNAKMIWKCKNPKHKEWRSAYKDVVKKGQWCPECSSKKYISENRVRLIFEFFYGQPFPSVKPKWNVNFLTGRCLELDGYCETVKVAFEHDGEHHSQIVSYNNKHESAINSLMYQKCKDYEKKQNCKRQGVLLINVPILEQRDRNVFQLFLDNVINSCKKCGLEMTFTDDQLATLEKQFFAV